MSSPPTEAPAPSPVHYWTESRRPLTSLVFVTPLLVVYEAGVLVLGTHATRNGADAWMRDLLGALGFSQYFLLPALTVCILLGWHHLTRQSWQLSGTVFYGMAAESVLLAFCLRFLAKVQGIFMRTIAAHAAATGGAGMLIGYLGAGIYEELLFRLILLSAVIAVFRWARLAPGVSMIAAALVTSLLFSMAHYIGPFRDEFLWSTFIFRTVAGMFFSLLFIYRGFGIVVGAHAGYDLLVGISRLWASG
jgi:membrane protease YdiL (CAAX protease family)